MRKQIKCSLTFILLCFSVIKSFSQDQKKDTITTDVINVVKPYTPTILDAFKVKETPLLDDEENTTKKQVKYNIFSFPVASTFTPAKGKATEVEKQKPQKLYDNYTTFGFGSYTTFLGEAYLNHAINRTESIGGYVSHHSSQGDIEGAIQEDDFSNSKINANYSKKLRDLSWNIEAGFNHQKYYWYGFPQPLINENTASMLNVAHAFYSAHLGGDINFQNAFINSGNVLFRRFGDDRNSGENRFAATSNVNIPIGDEAVKTTFKFDYLRGNFNRSYFNNEKLKYGNFQVGLSPIYQIIQEDLVINLGFSAYYVNIRETGGNKFYIYPNITASYNLVNDILIAYGGIQGDFIQNSYYSFVSKNQFVSPTLNIMPTDQQYNAFIGLKGKLSNGINYSISGSYHSDLNKALFINNEIISDSEQDYSYGNSFEVVYGNLDTFSMAGEINIDINRNFKLGIKAECFAYNINEQAEAWNLPDIKGSLLMDYQISKHWFTGANLFYMGKRKDQLFLNNPITPATPITVTLDSFFDANAHLGYCINDKISVFAKANNIANKAYKRWQNYPVQNIQFLAGATLKFNF